MKIKKNNKEKNLRSWVWWKEFVAVWNFRHQ